MMPSYLLKKTSHKRPAHGGFTMGYALIAFILIGMAASSIFSAYNITVKSESKGNESKWVGRIASAAGAKISTHYIKREKILATLPAEKKINVFPLSDVSNHNGTYSTPSPLKKSFIPKSLQEEAQRVRTGFCFRPNIASPQAKATFALVFTRSDTFLTSCDEAFAKKSRGREQIFVYNLENMKALNNSLDVEVIANAPVYECAENEKQRLEIVDGEARFTGCEPLELEENLTGFATQQDLEVCDPTTQILTIGGDEEFICLSKEKSVQTLKGNLLAQSAILHMERTSGSKGATIKGNIISAPNTSTAQAGRTINLPMSKKGDQYEGIFEVPGGPTGASSIQYITEIFADYYGNARFMNVTYDCEASYFVASKITVKIVLPTEGSAAEINSKGQVVRVNELDYTFCDMNNKTPSFNNSTLTNSMSGEKMVVLPNNTFGIQIITRLRQKNYSEPNLLNGGQSAITQVKENITLNFYE